LKFARLICKLAVVVTRQPLQDGEFVVLHNSFTNAQAFGAEKIVTFDIYRMKSGKAVEHWDAITPVVAKTASGRTQTDGATKITDLEKTPLFQESCRMS
jgi:predicted SnoaL-like aldol condensation-catalyzing enzyme